MKRNLIGRLFELMIDYDMLNMNVKLRDACLERRDDAIGTSSNGDNESIGLNHLIVGSRGESLACRV